VVTGDRRGGWTGTLVFWQEERMSDEAAPERGSEARATLLQIAGRRTLPIPPEMIVDHVLALPGGWDWPVRRAALEAVLRRLASARAQEIVVLDGPRRGSWGRRRLGRPGADGVLPYDVRLWSLAPLAGSCDCADFSRGALGLCKHLGAALAHLAGRPHLFRRLLAGPPAAPRGIVWDAAVDTSAAGDPLGALRFAASSAGGNSRARTSPPVSNLFRSDDGGVLRLRTTHAADPKKRLRLVAALLQHVRAAGAAADPAARAVLVQEHDRVSRILRLRDKEADLARAVRAATRRRRLYAYQARGVRRFLSQGRLVLADDMGLGKTTQAIVAATALYDVGFVRRGLLVVPAALKPQWEREWRAISAAPLRVVDGGASERQALYGSTRRGFLLTNYEQVIKDLDAIIAWSPDFAALDEAQRIKNWATKTALAVKRVKPEYRLVLTGTPLENRVDELASIVEWVDDRALEPKWRLVPWHSAHADGQREVREVIGARNLNDLRARLAPVLLRRVRAEVLGQLPARQDTTIPVDLTDRQRDAHDELNQPIAKLASIAGRRPLAPAEFLRLMSLLATQRMIANGLALAAFATAWPGIRDRAPTAAIIESLDAPKLLELRELLSSLVLTQQRKVVVFSQWRRMLELAAWSVSDLLACVGKRALFFTGQEGARRRTQNLVDFHDDPTAAVLFLTDAGGVGLNLQKAASACVNLELPWNPAVLEQRIGRIHRLGQDRPIDVYNLMSRGCIEERIAVLVADKRVLFKGVFEGTTDELRFDGRSAIASVLAELVPVARTAANGANGADDRPDDDETDPLTGVVDDGAPSTPVGLAEPVARTISADAVPAPVTTVVIGDSAGVARLFGEIAVQRRADGGVVIEAPPRAARELVSLFEGMARLMAAVSGDAPPHAAEPIPQGSRVNGDRARA
jgi:superfamily II DNA or RNA helicase